MDKNSLLINVRLNPKASRNAVAGWVRDAAGKPVLKASVTAAPEKGKANKALIALLADEWGIAKSRISVIRGETDRNKLLSVSGVTEEERQRLGATPE